MAVDLVVGHLRSHIVSDVLLSRCAGIMLSPTHPVPNILRYCLHALSLSSTGRYCLQT